MQLQQNISLSELTTTTHPFPNQPNQEELANLKMVAFALQQVRSHFGKPVTVSSAFRSEKVNQAVGGVSNSAHRLGYAADFTVKDTSIEEVFNWIKSTSMPWDQLIDEKKDGKHWLHLSVDPRARRMAFKDWS